MPAQITIRDYRADDELWALALNNQAVPAVNGHTPETWAELVDLSHVIRIAETPSGKAGFMILFTPGADYSSLNYRWFSAQYPSFLYVDRIVVDGSFRGSGVGRALYEDGITLSSEINAPVFTCEVNEEPPNPGSMAFHQRMGFEAVGRQATDGGEKRVVLMARPVDAPPEA